jgi:hypothetical protein
VPRTLALLLIAGCNLSPLAAQEDPPDTRQEEWARLREEKLTRLQPPQAGFLERNILAIEKAERPSLLDFNVGGVYPRLQAIGEGSQVAGGVRFWQPDIKGSPLDVHAAAFYSIRRYEAYELQVGLLPHRGRHLPPPLGRGDDIYEFGAQRRAPGRRVLAHASLRYHHLPEVDFFGVGNDSQPEDQTTFLLQDASYNAVVGYQHTERLVFSARAGLLQAFVGPGRDEDFPTTQDLFDDASAPGLTTQPDFFHVGVLGLFDFRDTPANPHSGGMLAVGAARFDDRGGDAYRFDRFGADARGFLSLGSRQRVLAVRAYAFADRPAAGSQVPFYLQETLGGNRTLRGYPSFRFRGEKGILLQAEYRWEAAPAVELSAFVDGGRMFAHDEDWSLEDLHGDWGLGLRLKTHDALLLRFDVAWSPEDTRLYLRATPAF